MSWNGLTMRPAEDKAKKWLRDRDTAISCRVLSPGDASKLAGRLSWDGSFMFKRLGRALLRPVFDQQTRHDGAVSAHLARALRWWAQVLRLRLSERVDWCEPASAPVHMFCDASSSPPYLGVVMFCDGEWQWTHSPVPCDLLNCFLRRRDAQIMGLELLAISLGLSTFASVLAGRCVIVHCDNKGSEASSLICPRRILRCVFARRPSGGARPDPGITPSSFTRNGCARPRRASTSLSNE